MTEVAAVKETKAQRVERLKREKNPWEAFDEVRRFAREGRASVVPEWASAYFKWWGVYTQGDGVGATGGKGGEGLATDYFMMRIGIPNGILNSQQLRVMGNLTRTHARNLADITVRQNLQLHWLSIESLPEVVDALDRVGLSPKGACGDVVRNVTGCPLAGVAADELIDASPLAVEIAELLTANPDFYNLPRKFKISVTGCPSWCSYPEINDIGFTAVRSGDQVGYSVRIGGGLSADPHLAVRLDAFVLPSQGLAVARAVTEIFRDQQGLRESRDRARLKHLFLKEGWTAESFLAELESRLDFPLLPGVPEEIPNDIYRDHAGIHPQRQPGLCYVGASVLRGRLSGEQLEAAAELAERFGSGALRATVSQNLLFIDVPNGKTSELAGELQQIGLEVEGSPFWRGAVACTGTEFCKLAITETKGFTRWLVDELEERLPEFDQQLKLHVTGCPNSCGQHWIADIGIEGKKIKHEGQLTDAYYFCVGGAVGKHAAIARAVGYRCPAPLVPEAIERLLRRYLADRAPEENLRAWFGRYPNDELRAHLAGEVLAPVERDTPTGRAPHGVD
ncbi:Dissimilatory sulfite reductase [Acidisarcina polymorpha]|uniref:Dissimilatory sulfite reductase n=1 Tax=Acidisarcina polymorpha TaxID=2211140 RepID=A0A2Z5FYA4_9BACT|nr:nitrite/sulfite reductase [Acidisarcina polymorpha]AXC11838.1 Dissimilatory sulfite reductase [Acidisarcina polymorpha]